MPTIDLAKLVSGVSESPSDFLVFWVNSSRSDIPPHMVDLQKYAGNGACDCEAFQFRFNKKLRQRAMPSPSLECQHIKQAKRYLLFKIINEAIDRREQQAEQNKKGGMDRGVSKAASAVGRTLRTSPPATADEIFNDPEVPY